MSRSSSRLFTQILTHPDLVARPPVLVDIGASGKIHATWKPVAPHAVCIAFDADRREMSHTTTGAAGYRQLHVFHSAVVPAEQPTADFHLTRSPFCSSLLKPDSEALEVWNFAGLFQVKQKTEVPCVTLNHVLGQLNLDYVDWFKTDSQGTDLRLFLSLPGSIRSRILTAEFEPGLIDAYQDEDKLPRVLDRLPTENFWLSSLQLKGPKRFSHALLQQQSRWKQRVWEKGLPDSPGWAEMVYLNSFNPATPFLLRDYLLGWLLVTLQHQHGFALELAGQAATSFTDPLLVRLQQHSRKKLTRNGLKKIPGWLFRKLRIRRA